MFLSGQTQEQLAAHFGVDQSTISRDLSTLRKRWEKQALENVDERIGIQDAQYNALIHAHWEKAMLGKGFDTDRVLAAMSGQAKLLGLDRPTKSEVNVGGSLKREYVIVTDGED